MSWLTRGAYATGAVATAVLAWLAFRADMDAPRATGWSAGADVAVGVVFVVAAAVARPPAPSRGWVAAVGAAWLVASVVSEVTRVHQALLVAALVAFPAALPHGRARWGCAAIAAPVAVGLVPQHLVAMLFVAVAATVLVARRSGAAWYPSGASLLVAAAVGSSWAQDRGHIGVDRELVVRVYELALATVAACYPLAARAAANARTRLTDRMLGPAAASGLAGLEAVLREVVGDRQLELYRWRGDDLGYADELGRPPVGGRGRQLLTVDDDEGPVAALEHRAGTLDDRTAEAVAAAVRLTVVNQRLQSQLAGRLEDLEAARARLVLAAEHQRDVAAARLAAGVVDPLRQATSDLHDFATTLDGGEAVEVLGITVAELEAAASEIVDLVGGVAAADLGGGRLQDALESLASRCPLPVTVSIAPGAAGDRDCEMTLYYFCSELLTNAVKHSGASAIAITLEADDRSVTATVTDDGRGGASATGSGLLGIADRVAARGGRLRVDSPPGAGTIVRATVPR